MEGGSGLVYGEVECSERAVSRRPREVASARACAPLGNDASTTEVRAPGANTLVVNTDAMLHRLGLDNGEGGVGRVTSGVGGVVGHRSAGGIAREWDDGEQVHQDDEGRRGVVVFVVRSVG